MNEYDKMHAIKEVMLPNSQHCMNEELKDEQDEKQAIEDDAVNHTSSQR